MKILLILLTFFIGIMLIAGFQVIRLCMNELNEMRGVVLKWFLLVDFGLLKEPMAS